MKIGFDAKRFFFNHSGLGNYSRRLIESMFQYQPNNEYFLYVDRLDALRVGHPEALRILKQYGDNDFEPYGNQKQKSLYNLVMVDANKLWRTWGMGQQAAKDGVEVFHGLSNELPWDLPSSVKSVCTIHDVIFKEFPAYYPWLDRIIYDVKTRRATKTADLLVMTSGVTQSKVEQYYPKAKGKSVVVYQAVDSAYYHHEMDQKSSESSSPYFVYHSSFTARKNHFALVEAFALIQHQTPWYLKLIGLDGPTLLEVKKQIQRLGIENRVECMVNLTQKEMVQKVKTASGFVYPSLSEGFGIPLAESLVSNLPMAVSNIPVFRELLEDVPVYFHPNNIEEMAAAMIAITTSEEQLKQRLKREHIKPKVDPEKISLQLLDSYCRLIAF